MHVHLVFVTKRRHCSFDGQAIEALRAIFSTSSSATLNSMPHRYSRGLPRPEVRGLRHSRGHRWSNAHTSWEDGIVKDPAHAAPRTALQQECFPALTVLRRSPSRAASKLTDKEASWPTAASLYFQFFLQLFRRTTRHPAIMSCSACFFSVNPAMRYPISAGTRLVMILPKCLPVERPKLTRCPAISVTTRPSTLFPTVACHSELSNTAWYSHVKSKLTVAARNMSAMSKK